MKSLPPWLHTHWQALIPGPGQPPTHHALLMTGAEGLGKRQLAEAIATAVSCKSPAQDGSACGNCHSCSMWAAQTHPDIHIAAPEGDSREIKISVVRELAVKLSKSGQMAGMRVAIIEPAHAMNIASANALLKTLEEPPPGCLIILISNSPSKLLATIRSRCRKVTISCPDREQAIAWLGNACGDSANELLGLAGGAPLKALRFAEAETVAQHRKLFNVFGKVCVGKADPLDAAELWIKEGGEDAMNWLANWHMDIIRVKLGAENAVNNPGLSGGYKRLAERMSTEVLYDRLAQIQSIRAQWSTTVNSQWQLEALFSRCMPV